ncbi:helix-turn-helix domain-containing protein [Halegenticoccus tardaugens]|uniref:helix-turn-helix domain-containing protein n=1 Tax=Halegenticoccus tardaugens TaxID=2071624 RepID=UPI00100AB701|nr:helix-turn-helix domain-containing protein [Halegenticoccus tardaugens]
MPGADRNDEGKYTDTYDDSAFVAAVQKLDGASTTEVAERIGCDRRTAYLRLKALEEEGRLGSRKIGNALLWRIATNR